LSKSPASVPNTPSLSDIKSIPGAKVTEKGNGEFEFVVRGGAGIKAFHEAQRPWARAEAERGHTRSATKKMVALRGADGREYQVQEGVADRTGKKKGLVPFGRARWGKGKRILVEHRGKLYRNVDGELVPA
jgi:hypothetical protein